jgi:hypothetical protein
MREMLPRANFTMRRQLDDGTIKEWTTPVIEQTAKFVCSRCNNNWGSDLECRMKDACATILLKPTRRIIAPDDCKALSDFAFKTTVLANHMSLSTGTPFFSDSERESFAKHLTIPAGVQVWIARRGTPFMTGMFRSVYGLVNTKPQFRFELYTCTFSFGFLILQSLTARWINRKMRHLVPPPPVKQPSALDEYAVRIWPGPTSLEWPIKGLIGEDTIELFWNRFGEIKVPPEWVG